jgi:hypothetical protein
MNYGIRGRVYIFHKIEQNLVGRIEQLYRETRHINDANSCNVVFHGEAVQQQPTKANGGSIKGQAAYWHFFLTLQTHPL